MCPVELATKNDCADWLTVKLVLVLVSTVIRGSDSRETHEHIMINVIARQRFGKHVPATTNRRSNRRNVGSDLSSLRPEL
jgi:hypothetical protein